PIVGIAHTFVGRAIEVVGRRKREDNAGADRMHPGEAAEDVLLTLAVACAIQLLLGIVWHLEEVCPRRADKPQLIGGRDVENQRCKRGSAGSLIVQIFTGGSFQAMVSAIAVHAEVISGFIVMIAEA